jgi:hypothetical protein
MTLPASGPLSLFDIGGKFADAQPHSMNEFYGRAIGLPTSGAISFSNFYSKNEINLTRNFFRVINGATAAVTMRCDSFNIGTAFANRRVLLVIVRSGGFGTVHITDAQLVNSAGTPVTTVNHVVTNIDRWYTFGVFSALLPTGTTAQADITFSRAVRGNTFVWAFATGLSGNGTGFHINQAARPVVMPLSGDMRRGTIILAGMFAEGHNGTRDWSITPSAAGSISEVYGVNAFGSRSLAISKVTSNISSANVTFNSSDPSATSDATAGHFAVWFN